MDKQQTDNKTSRAARLYRLQQFTIEGFRGHTR